MAGGNAESVPSPEGSLFLPEDPAPMKRKKRGQTQGTAPQTAKVNASGGGGDTVGATTVGTTRKGKEGAAFVRKELQGKVVVKIGHIGAQVGEGPREGPKVSDGWIRERCPTGTGCWRSAGWHCWTRAFWARSWTLSGFSRERKRNI